MHKILFVVIAIALTFNVNSQTVCKRIVADFGTFPASGYQVNGSATLIDSLGALYLTLSSDFSTFAGPDLYLYLSINDEAPTVPGNTNVEVALMISNTGTQTYIVPESYTLNDFDYVLIHCKQFNHLWDGGALGSLTCNSPTAVFEEEIALETLVVKNNASASSIKIEVNSLDNSEFSLRIYTISGKLIHSSFEFTNVEINIEQYISTGLFFLEVNIDNRRYFEKIISK